MPKQVSVQTDAEIRAANRGVNRGVGQSEGTDPTSLSSLWALAPYKMKHEFGMHASQQKLKHV